MSPSYVLNSQAQTLLLSCAKFSSSQLETAVVRFTENAIFVGKDKAPLIENSR